MQVVRRHVKSVAPNARLEARVHCAAGTARSGQWTWSVRRVRTGQVVARSLRPYVRRFYAERGALRAFPTATLVEE